MNEAIVEKVKALIAAPSCYAGLKKIAEEYIAALGSDREKEAGRKLVKAKGGKWCDCPACAPGREILDRKEELC